MKDLFLWLCLCLAVVGTALSSCTALEYSLSADTEASTPAASSQAPAPAAGTSADVPKLQPAPAGSSRAEANRFYRAQLDAIKAGQARKIKNSGNTTVEQNVTNISPGLLRTMGFVIFTFGVVVGAGVMLKFGRA